MEFGFRPPPEVFPDLRAIHCAAVVPQDDVRLRFDGFSADGSYVVTGTPVVEPRNPTANTFQVVAPLDDDGIVVRFQSPNNEPNVQGFMVQVLQIV